MDFTPYLNFDGRCEEAFQFYAKCFDGKVTFKMTYAEMPGHQVPEGWGSKLAHITLNVGGQIIRGADAHGDHYKKPQGISISVSLSDPAAADRIFAALAEGGQVGMAIQETFWAARFGMVTDRFSTPWMINCEKPRS